MSASSRIDKLVQGLLPLESYRSPWLPTQRLPEDALVAVAAPFRQRGELSMAPSVWFAVTPDFGTLLAFARTRVVSPVTGFEQGPVESRSSEMSARAAHAALWRVSETAWPDFFAARPPAPGIADEVAAALDATVPARLLPWIHLCCADYFEWLALSPAATVDNGA